VHRRLGLAVLFYATRMERWYRCRCQAPPLDVGILVLERESKKSRDTTSLRLRRIAPIGLASKSFRAGGLFLFEGGDYDCKIASNLLISLKMIYKEKRRVAPPWMFSQRNNPYCDLPFHITPSDVVFDIAKVLFFSKSQRKGSERQPAWCIGSKEQVAVQSWYQLATLHRCRKWHHLSLEIYT